MTKTKRSAINIFLLALDEFLTKYYELDNNIKYDFIPLFLQNQNKAKKSISKWNFITLKTLDRLCNRYYLSETVQNNSHKEDIDKMLRQKKSSFVQKIAYWLDYKMIKDLSYEHIFYKMALSFDRQFPYEKKYIGYLSKFQLQEFIVPVEYISNDDLIIY